MKILLRLLRGILPPSPSPPRLPDCSPANDLIQTTLDHAKVGYQNAQDVIKFVDTKTAVITGLSTVTAGFLLAVLKWSIESDGVSRPNLYQVTASHACAAVFFYASVLLSLLSLLTCLAAAVWSVIAQAPPRNRENTFWVLFPLYRRSDARTACISFERKLKGMSKSDILKEYGDQLRIVGMILGQKLNHIRISCIAILVQMITLSVAVGLLTYMYVTYQVKHSVPPPRCPNSHNITMAVFFPSIIPQRVKRCTYLGRRFFLVFFPIPVPRQRTRVCSEV